MRNFVKRPTVVIAIVILSLGVSGLAIAFWTTSGSGSGTAKLADGTTTVTLTATVPDGVAPGLDRQVTITATPSSSQSVHIGSIRLTGFTPDGSHSGCNDPTWFSMADVLIDQTITGPGATQLTPTGTLHMNDLSSTNQDACKGATLTLSLSAV
jgi:hypothetical protein